MSWTSYTLRSEGVHLSAEVHRYLRIIAKAASSDMGKVTRDQVADELLRKVIEEEYSFLLDGQKEIDAIEKKMISSIHSLPATT